MADFIAAIAESWQTCVTALADISPAWRAELVAEASDFVRFNGAAIRQGGTVQDAQMQLTLMVEGRSGYRRFPLTGVVAIDQAQLDQAVAELCQEVPQLPSDPFLVLPEGSQRSRVDQEGAIPPVTEVIPAIISAVRGLDFTGLYAGGGTGACLCGQCGAVPLVPDCIV